MKKFSPLKYLLRPDVTADDKITIATMCLICFMCYLYVGAYMDAAKGYFKNEEEIRAECREEEDAEPEPEKQKDLQWRREQVKGRSFDKLTFTPAY